MSNKLKSARSQFVQYPFLKPNTSKHPIYSSYKSCVHAHVPSYSETAERFHNSGVEPKQAGRWLFHQPATRHRLNQVHQQGKPKHCGRSRFGSLEHGQTETIESSWNEQRTLLLYLETLHMQRSQSKFENIPAESIALLLLHALDYTIKIH